MLLSVSAVVPAQKRYDSLTLHEIPVNTRPAVYSQVNNGDNNGPMTDFQIWVKLYRDQYDLPPHTRVFYKNLRDASQNRQVTRLLYEMMIREPVTDRSRDTKVQTAENGFLPHAGKTINDIRFSTTGFFTSGIDDPFYQVPARVERIAMLLHSGTREKIIMNNLLFRTGDRLDPFLLAENERILRQLSYLEDARIYVIADKLNAEYADILVVTKDRLPYGFDGAMSDIDEGRIEIFDRNLMGLGHGVQATLLYEGRRDKIFGYKAGLNFYNTGGSFINTEIDYLDAFGNNVFHIRSGRDFITPSIKYGGGVEFIFSGLTDDFNFPDTSFINQRLNYHEYDYWFGRSFLLSGEEDGIHKRSNIYLTSRFNRILYFERPDIDLRVRHEFHNRNLFLVSLAFTRLGYLKSSYIYGFGPTEDIPMGTRFETTVGYEDNQFFPRIYGGLSLSNSNYLERIGYLKNTVSLAGFFNDGTSEQGLLSVRFSGFSNLLDMNRFFMRQFFSLSFTKGYNRFDDELISISNHRGIRGLGSNMLQGTQKLTLQLETIFYARRNWYGFRYALYGLADLGWVGDDSRVIIKQSFYSGFGIGMKVRNEHLVLPTLQFRLAFFPRVPESASFRLFYIASERRPVFDEFKITAPEIIPYR